MSKEKVAKKRGGASRAVLGCVLGVVGLIVVVVVVLQVVLSPSMLTKIVNNVAENYVDGEVRFGRVSVSMLRHFPNLSVSLDSVSLTYPTERFADLEDGSPLLRAGKGEVMDTLASFNHFTAAVNLVSLVGGTVNIRLVDLDKPRIYAKNFGDGTANWNILNLPSAEVGEVVIEDDGAVESAEDEVADVVAQEVETIVDSLFSETDSAEPEESETFEESGSGFPNITVGRIRLHNHAVIVLCSKPDNLFATLGLRNMSFRGKLTTKNLSGNKLGFKVDSLFIGGRLQEDTLALGLEKLAVRQIGEKIDLDLNARTAIASGSMGRMRLPVSVKSEFTLPKDSIPSISISSFEANFAGIPLSATADVRWYGDRLFVNADAAIRKCRVKDVIDNFGKNFWPEAADFHTDATVTLTAFANGWLALDGSEIPQVRLTVDIPDTPVVNRKIKLNSHIGLAAWARGGGGEAVDVGIDDFHFTGNTIQLNFSGSAADLLGGDPNFTVDADLSVGLDTLANLIERETGFAVGGNVFAKAKGSILSSQIDPYNFAGADLMGFVKTDRLDVVSEKDSINLHLDSLSIIFGTQDNTRDTTLAEGTRLMALGAKLDSVLVKYKDAVYLHGTGLHLSGWNDAAVLDKNSSSSYYPFSGTVKIGSLALADAESNHVVLLGSENRFTIKPSPKDREIPVLTLTTDNKSFRAKMAYNRVAFGDLNVSLTATKSGAKRQKMARALVDSLVKRHPEIERDSLFSYIRSKAGERELPDWLSEEDFRKSDLDFKLDETLAKYYKEWDFDGSLGLDRAILMTPSLPLRNTLTKVNMTINNDAFTLKNLTVRSGRSDLSARGRLSGLRQGLLNNGMITLKMDIESDTLNLNELLTAYSLGQKITAKLDSLSGSVDELDDDEYMDMVAVDTISGNTAPESSLLVIPANVSAEIKLDAEKVAYSILDMDSMHTDITMKERCLQMVNTGATSNVGNLTAEAFYSTKTKEDITAGFNIAFEDISAEKIIEMMPAVDSLMPMLKSFRGNLTCIVAATAEIDTLMNIKLPTLNGVLRIQGKDLALVESESLYKILKILRFSDVTNVKIEDMSVEALISDSKIEIFPFVLTTGKYQLALAGIQNLDQSFSYHVSVIKSPLLIRFGVNFTGQDFDHLKFRLGKAVYKDENVQVFSAVIDSTRLNLSDAIRNIFTKGVDAAVRETREHREIEAQRAAVGYVNPAETEIEELDEEESGLLDEASEEVSDEASGDVPGEASDDEASGETSGDVPGEASEEVPVESSDSTAVYIDGGDPDEAYLWN